MTITWGEILAVVASVLWGVFVPLLAYAYLSDRRSEREARGVISVRIDEVEADFAGRITEVNARAEKAHNNAHELRELVHVQGIKIERLEENKEHTAKSLEKLEATVRETFKELSLKLDRLLSYSGSYSSGPKDGR